MHFSPLTIIYVCRSSVLLLSSHHGYTLHVPNSHFRKRDWAHKEVKRIFYEVIQQRRESKQQEDDILQTLLDSKYKYVCFSDSVDFLRNLLFIYI